jgi:hypothetical protein
MANDQVANGGDEVLKEHVERVFRQYEARDKAFRSTHFWLLTFSAFFLFLVLFPYLSIQNELRTLPARLAATEAEIQTREARIEAFRRSAEGFEQLRTMIQNGPAELRTFIGAAARPTDERSQQVQVAQQQQQQQSLAERCDGLAGEERLSCRVEVMVHEQFEHYRRLLESEVAAPLLEADGNGAPLVDPDELKAGLDRLQARFEARISDNPTFWRAYDQKGEFFVELADDVDTFWRDYEELIAQHSAVLDREKADLVAAQAELLAARADMEELKGELKTRLDAIDTPFGKLPVGLNEAILAFPVLIAVGFLISARQLADAARLRSAFGAFYRQKDPAGGLITEQQIALIAPLWLDADRPGHGRALPFLALTAPILVFVIAILAVAGSWLATEFFRAVGMLNLRIFAGLYLLGIVAILMGCAQIRRALGDARLAESANTVKPIPVAVAAE